MTRLWKLRSGALAGLLALSVLRCNGGNIEPPVATDIAPVSGDGQNGAIEQPLPNPLVVAVTDASGNPVSGVSVQWAAQGGGSVSAATVQTGADGRAAVQRVLGPNAGEQTTTATVTNLQGSPVTFVSTATDASAPSLTMRQQPSASAQSGVEFAVQPVIQLENADGSDRAQSGLDVTASVATGTGTLGGTLTRATDANGTATFTDLKITAPAGTYVLRFTAAGTNQALSAPITISGAAGGIVITTNPPVAALDGEVFSPQVQPAVAVSDPSGAPVSGAQVTARIASGGGTLEGNTTATTNAAGAATFADLGIRGTGTHTLEFIAGTASVTSSPVSVSALSPKATTGEWGQLVNWDIVPLHMTLMPNGKILAWGKTEIGDTMGMPRIWDPAAGPPTGLPEIHIGDMLFCAGHTLMPDGRLMVSGGHHKDDAGIKTTYFFSPDGAPQKDVDMAYGRWYPTVTILEDGRALTMGGRDEGNKVVKIPEIWENGQWVQLPGDTLNIPYYPRNFVDPKNGLIFYAGERVQSRWYDVDGTGAHGRGHWIPGPTHRYGFNRDYGSAVMYDAGKILYVGGGGHPTWRQAPEDPRTNVPTATAETIDLNDATPGWSFTGSMAFPRRHMNATVLPDGQVLATGGTRGGGFVNIIQGNAVKAAELWNPTTGQWTTLASASTMRVYHSVSLLLADGTVLHGSSGDAMAQTQVVPPERNHEIFSPPYLFKGVRPTITSAPASVGYNQTFSVATPNAAQVTQVRWIRLGSVTHAFDASARANTLSFQINGGNVEVTAPPSPRQAPPGHYLLFILNRNGVPSAGKIVQVQ
jgi:galactose oxidase-like protein/Big-like domain-containing protein